MANDIFLTFDDGPNEPYTSQILAVLKEYGAQAAFFVCGKNIERSPQSIKSIIEAGHDIGIHSYSHNLRKVLAGDLLAETEKTRELIRRFSGVDTNLYRSPWGITMPWLKNDLQKKGYKIFHWHIMAFDWWQPSANFISQHILRRIFPGAVILLHDGDQVNSDSRTNTVEALRIFLPLLVKRGYGFGKLSNIVNLPENRLYNLAADICSGLIGR